MKQNVLALLVGLAIGLVAGFLLANSYNRSNASGAMVSVQTPASSQDLDDGASLSPEEIREKIAQADSSPEDIAFQRNLGMALYAYGASKEDAALIGEALRLLDRVLEAEPADREVLIASGNGNFDIGYFKKENGRFERARGLYLRALESKADDPSVLVDVGLTFALLSPPDYNAATAYYEKALRAEPNHERTLQMMTDAHLKQGDSKKAAAFLDRLKAVKPSNPMIPEFETALRSRP